LLHSKLTKIISVNAMGKIDNEYYYEYKYTKRIK